MLLPSIFDHVRADEVAADKAVTDWLFGGLSKVSIMSQLIF